MKRLIRLIKNIFKTPVPKLMGTPFELEIARVLYEARINEAWGKRSLRLEKFPWNNELSLECHVFAMKEAMAITNRFVVIPKTRDHINQEELFILGQIVYEARMHARWGANHEPLMLSRIPWIKHLSDDHAAGHDLALVSAREVLKRYEIRYFQGDQDDC